MTLAKLYVIIESRKTEQGKAQKTKGAIIMTKIEKMTINLFCDYVMRAQVANVTMKKADEQNNEQKWDKARAHQHEMYAAADRLLHEVIVYMDPHEVINGIEAWNKANEDNYDGTSDDELRKVDVPDEVYSKIINRPSRID